MAGASKYCLYQTLAIIQTSSYPHIKNQPGVGPLSQSRNSGYILNYESIPEEALEISVALGKVWVVVCLGQWFSTSPHNQHDLRNL